MFTKNLLIAFSVLLAPCYGRELIKDDSLNHHFKATEWDVVSPMNNPCTTERGFFGRNAKYDQAFNYQYELTLVEGLYDGSAGRVGDQPSVGLEGVFSAIETRIADALLESKVFESVCAGGIARGPFRREEDDRKLLRDTNNRQMRAVGISSTPDDQILEGCK